MLWLIKKNAYVIYEWPPQEWRNLSTNATAIFTENRPYEAVHYYLLIVSNGRVSFDVKVNFSKKIFMTGICHFDRASNNEFSVEF
jgi:hypothetical protein